MKKHNSLDLESLAAELEEGRLQDEYLLMNLAFNPFPVAGTRSGDIEIPDLSDQEPRSIRVPLFPPLDSQHIETIRQFIRSTLRVPQFAGLKVVGDYGFGKSHMLRFIEHQINSFQGEIRGGRIRAFYVENPSTRAQDLLFALTKSIGRYEFWKMAWAVILKELRNLYKEEGLQRINQRFFPQPSIFELSEDDLADLFSEDTLSNPRRFVEKYQQLQIPGDSVRNVAQLVLSRRIDNLDIVQQVVSIAFEEEYTAFQSWIALTAHEARRRVKVPLLDHFSAILKILELYGISFIYILIDEFEDLAGVRVSARQRAEYEATLRMFINAKLQHFAMILAAAPEGFQIIKETYPPFMDLFTYQIELKPLDNQQTKQLIIRHLDLARTDEQLRSHQGSVVPFTQGAVDAIAQEGRGNPRTILNLAHRSVEHCRSNRLSSITPDIVAEL